MSERSPDLRKILTESIDPEQIEKGYRTSLENPYAKDERREQLKKNLEEERGRIEKFKKRYQSLLERYAEMPSEDFDKEYEEAARELREIIIRVRRYSDECLENRNYTVDFVDLDKVKSLGEFVEAFPMQFVPRKKEIGRILALAKQMHETRIKEGAGDSTEPIKIVDIGGASGALGKLITDLAKENGLEIEYTVVDPDKTSVEAASKFYQDNPQLKFREQRGGDFDAEQYRDNPKITNLLKRRKEIIAEGQRKATDLQKIVVEIKKQEDANTLDRESIRRYLNILRENFDIDWPEALTDDAKEFLAKFDDQEDEETYKTTPFIDLYMKGWRKHVADVTEGLERHIRQAPERYDLVINSWMPPGVDLTKEIREANGAAILYALERYGATGCRSDAGYPMKPQQVGYEESYNPGTTYKSRLGWISHATPQLQDMMRDPSNTFWERHGRGYNAYPFSNGFVVQTKKSYSKEPLRIEPGDAGIKVKGSYPWEEELAKRGGEISSTAELRDENGELNYSPALYDLEWELEERERKKTGKAA
jgi:hypothetical protein